MKYNFKECHVPTTLSQLKEAIANFKKEAKFYKNYVSKHLNYGYKQLDWNKKFFTSKQIKSSMIDDYFKCYKRLIMDREIVKTQNLIDRQNAQGICLLKEIASTLQKKYFKNDSRGDFKWRPKYVPFYFESKYLGKCYICSYPQTMEWKAPLLTEFLQDKQYIFDQDNQFGRPLKELRKFIGKNLMNGKVEKWDYYFQRFLSESTK